jgi:hypothetical protein
MDRRRFLGDATKVGVVSALPVAGPPRAVYRGWMHGMPHAVKDLADVVGFPTSQGSPIYAGTVSRTARAGAPAHRAR